MAHQSGLVLWQSMPWKAGNYLILGNGSGFVLLGRRILDEKTGAQGEDCPSPFGSVFGLWNTAALLVSLNNQHTRVTTRTCSIGKPGSRGCYVSPS